MRPSAGVSIEELAQGLRESSLRTLILTENYTFGDDACAALAEAVRQAPSLKLIDVSNNSLYFPGVSKISTASKQKNVTVESVGNFSTEEMLSALTHGLIVCRRAGGVHPAADGRVPGGPVHVLALRRVLDRVDRRDHMLRGAASPTSDATCPFWQFDARQ